MNDKDVKKIVEFNELLSLSQKNDKAIIGRPDIIRADEYDNIYVSDVLAVSIKVFDKKGDFLFEFGKRGNGPQEMLQISAMDIKSDTLVVLDRGNLKILLWKIGESLPVFLTEFKVPNNNGQDLALLNNNQFVLLSKLTTENDLVHVYEYDNNIFTKKHDLIPFDTNPLSADKFVLEDIAPSPGVMWIDKEKNQVYQAPNIYGGNIFRSSLENKNSVIKIKGIEIAKPYTLLKTPPPGLKYYTSLSSDSDQYLAVVHYKSVSVFDDNEWIFHFYSFQKDGMSPYILGTELFRKSNLDFAGHDSKVSLTLKNNNKIEAMFFPKWKDNKNRYYIIDVSSGIPEIRIASLKVQG
jgi:hypothetical protein